MWTRIQREGQETAIPFESVQALLRAAQRLLAAECCGFMQEADPSLERWEPYVTWASRLTELDTVVTFNYDLVVETAASSEQARDLGGKGITVVTFGEMRDNPDFASAAKMPILLKLHGSVDWRHVADRPIMPFERTGEREFAINQGLDVPLSIATPGPTKGTLATTHLKPLWDLAKKRLSEADQILFIGYRFPPSDSQARSELLGAIASNPPLVGPSPSQAKPRPLGMHVVLGDSDAAASRLTALLRFAGDKSGRVAEGRGVPYAITRHPLFAEDFLSVANIRGAPALVS
jgi:hypothetical protein